MIPASIRNNNPGAMYPGPSSRKFGATSFETLRSKDGVHKIATFPTSVHGAAAQFDLLARDYTGVSLERAITRWCGGFYAPTYLKVLRDRADVSAETVLTKAMLADHDFAIPLAKAMAWQEAGCDYPMKEEDWLEAHQMAFGQEAAAPAWNPRNDAPTPKIQTRREPILRRIKQWFAGIFGTIGSVGVVGAISGEGPAIPAPPAGMKQSFVNLGDWAGVIPASQWKMLMLGASVFAAVSVGSWVIGRARDG